MLAYNVDPGERLKIGIRYSSCSMTSGASGWLRRGEVPLSLLKWTVPAPYYRGRGFHLPDPSAAYADQRIVLVP